MLADSHYSDRGPSGPGSLFPHIPLAFELLRVCPVSSAYTSKASTSTERHSTKTISASLPTLGFPSLSIVPPPTKLSTVRLAVGLRRVKRPPWATGLTTCGGDVCGHIIEGGTEWFVGTIFSLQSSRWQTTRGPTLRSSHGVTPHTLCSRMQIPDGNSSICWWSRNSRPGLLSTCNVPLTGRPELDGPPSGVQDRPQLGLSLQAEPPKFGGKALAKSGVLRGLRIFIF